MKFQICAGLFLAGLVVVAAELKDKRSIYDQGYGGHESESHGNSHHEYHHEKPVHTNINIHDVQYKTVEIPHPYPVHIVKNIPAPYPVEVKVPVDHPRAVPVIKPYPVQVVKHVPYPVEKTIPYPVKVPYNVPYPVKVAVPVEKPYPVHVTKNVPYVVRQPVYIEKKVPVYVHEPKHHHEQQSISYGSEQGSGFHGYGSGFQSSRSEHGFGQQGHY